MSRVNQMLMQSLVFGIVGAVGGPAAAVLAKLAEDLWSDQEQSELERRIAAIEHAIGRDPEAVRVNLDGVMTIIAGRTAPDQLRHATSCLAVISALNTRSRHATDWDPHFTEEDVLEVLRGVPGVASAEKELALVVHELDRAGLIRRYVSDIGPSEDFFAKTDPLFQPWNPRDDARELCRRAQETENRIHLRQLDQQLGWGPRRMNAAIAYLKTNGLADDYGGMMNGEYLNHDVTLTTEATFFLEETP